MDENDLEQCLYYHTEKYIILVFYPIMSIVGLRTFNCDWEHQKSGAAKIRFPLNNSKQLQSTIAGSQLTLRQPCWPF